MHPRTTATLEKLEKAIWFANIGVADTDSSVVLGSWQEAIDHCSSVEWENLCLEAMNQYCERIQERSPERLNAWNDVVADLKATTVPFVQRKIRTVVLEQGLPRVFEDTVQWDILGVCMEAEYADVYQPGFYASQAYWCVKGHFPCGWKGEFPEGMLII